MPLEPDWWLELESTYETRIVQRLEIYATEGTAVVDALPGSDAACIELMEMAIQFLCARYPNQFKYDSETGIFWNGIRDLHFETHAEAGGGRAGEGKGEGGNGVRALRFLLENVPEDFAVMVKDETTGLYYLRAAVIVSAVGWNLHDKMGRPMHEIHGPVPDYNEKIRHSVDR